MRKPCAIKNWKMFVCVWFNRIVYCRPIRPLPYRPYYWLSKKVFCISLGLNRFHWIPLPPQPSVCPIKNTVKYAAEHDMKAVYSYSYMGMKHETWAFHPMIYFLETGLLIFNSATKAIWNGETTHCKPSSEGPVSNCHFKVHLQALLSERPRDMLSQLSMMLQKMSLNTERLENKQRSFLYQLRLWSTYFFSSLNYAGLLTHPIVVKTANLVLHD